MSKETLIKLLEKSLSNFDSTEDMEHLDDMIAIICEYAYLRERSEKYEEAAV